jgi:hypothetical protein
VRIRSTVVNHLQTTFGANDVAIACIYCNYKEQLEQTVRNLIASILKQMLQDSCSISDNIKSLYKRHNERGTRPALDELTTELNSEIRMYSKVFIIVDALDECSEDNGTRAGFLRSLQSLDTSVRLLFTSRDLPSIGREFQGADRLEIHVNDEDVRRYVEERIANAPRLSGHSKELQNRITNKIVGDIGGM